MTLKEKLSSRKFWGDVFVSIIGLVAIFMDFDPSLWNEMAGLAAIVLSNIAYIIMEGKVDIARASESLATIGEIAELVVDLKELEDEKVGGTDE